jgi:hypothetical protein
MVLYNIFPISVVWPVCCAPPRFLKLINTKNGELRSSHTPPIIASPLYSLSIWLPGEINKKIEKIWEKSKYGKNQWTKKYVLRKYAKNQSLLKIRDIEKALVKERQRGAN